MGKKYIFCVVVFLTLICFGCSRESEPMTIEEGKHLKYHVTLGGVDFNIPVLHYFSNHLRPVRAILYKPPEYKTDINKRHKVSRIRFRAVLPDMEPLNEVNFPKLGTPRFGRTVKAYMKDFRVKQSLFFENKFPKLIPLPASPSVPNMLRYKDTGLGDRIVYLNGTKPAEGLIRIECVDEYNPGLPNHSDCILRRLYLGKFDLELLFLSENLPQWQEIDQKMLTLLDSFVDSASTSNNKR